VGRTPSPAVPAAAALLFALWIAYLATLAWSTRRPVVLSRPQFLVAPLVVIADVPIPGEPPVVRRVVHAAPGVPRLAEGSPVDVVNLGPNTDGWTTPGRYILPLAPLPRPPGSTSYRVIEIPRSPGYPGGPARVYPATPQAEQSLSLLLAELHG